VPRGYRRVSREGSIAHPPASIGVLLGPGTVPLPSSKCSLAVPSGALIGAANLERASAMARSRSAVACW
jgi:hypothetical protein